MGDIERQQTTPRHTTTSSSTEILNNGADRVARSRHTLVESRVFFFLFRFSGARLFLTAS